MENIKQSAEIKYALLTALHNASVVAWMSQDGIRLCLIKTGISNYKNGAQAGVLTV